MAASWGQYASALLLIFQALICFHLYVTQIALVERIESLQVEDRQYRAKRDVRATNIENTLISNNGSSEDVVVNDEEPFSVAPKRRHHHKKSHRFPVERFYVNTESTTTGPVMIRSSRTKLTSSRTKSQNVPKETLRRVQALTQEDPTVISGEFQPMPPVAVHFFADSSNYTRDRHPHYAGNGRIKISGIYSDWRAAPWTYTLGSHQHFRLERGKVSVSQPGLYLLYAQIHYANVQEVNCYRAIQNGQTIAQCCSTTAHPDRHEIKANTCSLLTTVYLEPKDNLWLADVHERFVILTPEKSYFGLVQLFAAPSN